MQFPDWYTNFVRSEKLKDYVEPEIKKTVRKRVLKVDKKQFKFIRAEEKYNSDPRSIKVFHTNMYETRVHFWLNSLTGGTMVKVEYTRHFVD